MFENISDVGITNKVPKFRSGSRCISEEEQGTPSTVSEVSKRTSPMSDYNVTITCP